MAKNYIKAELEFFDVISAFPILKKILENQNINTSTIIEGVTIRKYLENKSMTQKEIEVFIKKLNFELNSFLLEGKNNELELKDIPNLIVDEIERVEEEEEEE